MGVPLFWTIPAHKKLVAEQEQEKKLLNENETLFRNFFNAHDSYKKSKEVDPRNILFLEGQFFLNHGRSELAFYYFSQVSPDALFYSQAMVECANYLLSIGDNQQAIEYANKSNDDNLKRRCHGLELNPDASPLCIHEAKYPTEHAPLLGYDGVRSSVSYGTGASSGEDAMDLSLPKPLPPVVPK